MVCTLATALIALTTTAFGAVKEDSFSITPIVGGYVYDKDHQKLDTTVVLGIRGGYNFTGNIGVEALYDYAISDATSGQPTDIKLHRFGGQALYHFFPDNIFVPYLAAGFSGVTIVGTGFDNTTHGAFDYGVGAKYFLTDDVAIRGDVRHILYRYDSTTFSNVEFTLGAYFQFGGAPQKMKAIAPAPEPVKVVAAPASAPTPEPVVVVAAPASAPEPVKVAPAPPVDSDGDGVIDTLDKCPGTPQGVAVDGNGCPIDSDKDGVADYLDKCPATPAGVAVDAKGCPVDTDNDGVADYLDKCPATPAGVAVDAKGCPVEAAKKFCDKPSIIAISFDANKAVVKEQYHAELDKLGNFLKEFPNSKGIIEGHTDADGSKEANLKLSQARADNLRKYIINKFGIAGDRLTAKGYGLEKPVASNKTAAGKAKNRRIEAIFSCE